MERPPRSTGQYSTKRDAFQGWEIYFRKGLTSGNICGIVCAEVKEMASLKVLQAYADKCAERLGIAEKPILRWQDGYGCRMEKTTYAHCHIIADEAFPRGTICLSRKWFSRFSVKQWHHTIAHEVTHLAVKSAHRTPTFDRRMLALGVANDGERRNARSARKGHRHIWMSITDERPGDWHGDYRECRICHKRERYT